LINDAKKKGWKEVHSTLRIKDKNGYDFWVWRLPERNDEL